MSEGKTSLAPDILAPQRGLCLERGPRTRPAGDSSFHHLASVGACLSLACAAERGEPGPVGAGGCGQAGLGDWALGTPPTLQSGQAATLAPSVSWLPDTGSSNFSGEKGLRLFLSWEQEELFSQKGPNWRRSHVHTPSHTSHDMKRGSHGGRASRERRDSWGMVTVMPAHGPQALKRPPPSSSAQEWPLPPCQAWQCTGISVPENTDGGLHS